MSLSSSYPPMRYQAAGGEITASFRSRHADADYAAGPVSSDQRVSYHYLATQASTGGDYGLYRVDMGPRAMGPTTDFHRTMSESFFVLDGTLQLFDGQAWRDGEPGDFLYVPPGGLHAFRNSSGAPVSVLMLFAPGAPREEYFEGIEGLAEKSGEERARFFIEHDSFFVRA